MFSKIKETIAAFKKEQPERQVEPLANKRLLITEFEMKQFAKVSHGLVYKCKNCGEIQDGIHQTRSNENYCRECRWWICNSCRISGIKTCGNCEAAAC